MKYYDVINKNVVITGGANGIGLELVYLFVKKGANVIFIDIDAKQGKMVEKATSGKAKFLEGNIADSDSVRDVVNRVLHEFKQIHILINNAAIMRAGKFVETDFEDVIKTNLIGTMNVTQLMLPFMQSGDKILNVLSIHAVLVRQNKISYDVSNAGLLMFTQSLALELKNKGVCVNAISFGSANTNMKDSDSSSSKVVFEAQEIANHIINILENFSPYTTGSNFVMDGV